MYILYVILYSGKFSRCAKFPIFRGLVGMCENKNHENLNRWSKYDVTVGSLGSTKIWAWSHVRRARKLKMRTFLLEASRETQRKFVPAKISRYTVRCASCTVHVLQACVPTIQMVVVVHIIPLHRESLLCMCIVCIVNIQY